MSATARGTDFEKQVFSYLEEELNAGRFYCMPKWSTIYHQKRYYSRDRNSNIVFDIAIEVRLPGFQSPSVFCLVECKDHNRSIQVDEVEAFFAKIQQVAPAAAKGILISTSSFQPGALEYARSKRIGLLRFPQRKWVLRRTIAAGYAASFEGREAGIRKGLTEEDYQIPGPDCVCNFGEVFTYSLYDFVSAITADVLGNASYIIAAERPVPAVPRFMSQETIDARCHIIHDVIGYNDGPVSLQAICEWQKKSCGLTVLRHARAEKEPCSKGILGRIAFAPPSIEIFSDPTSAKRERFTLAHELGHLLLGHGEYLRVESFDMQDIENSEKDDLESDMIRRLEWQANRFAASLLLPRQRLIQGARTMAKSLGLRDKGFGLIYRDHQPENRRNYMHISSALMEEFNASRTAIELRLKGLGLLRD